MNLLKAILPYGFVTYQQARRREARRNALEEVLRAAAPDRQAHEFDFEAAIRFLVQQGCQESQVRAGSIPAESLGLIRGVLSSGEYGSSTLGLHVGNFVGISLACLATVARFRSKESLVLAIDPDIPHRGVEFPQRVVAQLLSHFGLTRHVSILAAYSLEKSPGNDGLAYVPSYNPSESFPHEAACENGLLNVLRLTGPESLGFVLIDGNHDDLYLRRELDVAVQLLEHGGLLILDDVSETWPGIKNCFEELGHAMDTVVEDGRIGILQKP